MKHCTLASPRRRFVLHCPLCAISESERTHMSPSASDVWMNCTAEMTTLHLGRRVWFHMSCIMHASWNIQLEKPKIIYNKTLSQTVLCRRAKACSPSRVYLHVSRRAACPWPWYTTPVLVIKTCIHTRGRSSCHGPSGKSAHRPGCFSHPLTADVFNYCYKHHFMHAHSASQHTKETKQIV